MSWSQTLVVSWMQFVLAAALLLAAAWAVMRWIVQPAERIRLIQLTLAAALAFPLLMALAPLPAWRLGLISATSASDAISVQRTRDDTQVVSMAAVDQRMPPDTNGSWQRPLEESALDIAPAVGSAPLCVARTLHWKNQAPLRWMAG